MVPTNSVNKTFKIENLNPLNLRSLTEAIINLGFKMYGTFIFIVAFELVISIQGVQLQMKYPSVNVDNVLECNITAEEYHALYELYNSTYGDNWIWHNVSNSSVWQYPSSRSAPCSDNWQGIYCEKYSDDQSLCSIVGIVLPLSNLQGSIPMSIVNISNLKILELPFNFLIGAIPSNVGTLSGLTVLTLQTNLLSGMLPASIGRLSHLEVLSLYRNHLHGAMPSVFGNLTNLRELYLYRNSFSGEIPSELGNIPTLSVMSLFENLLTGSIPSSVGQLKNLSVLNLHNNYLSGSIPSEIGNLSNLTFLNLYVNALSGYIPSELGTLPSLSVLDLATNFLSKTIPYELSALNSLTLLSLESNRLTGTIPSQLSSLSSLLELYLDSNPLHGTIPSALGYLSALTIMFLYSSSLEGSVPPELGLLRKLTQLSLNDNKLTGTLSTELALLSSMQQLDLDSNYLSGTIPTQFGSLFNATVLYLYSNHLQGTIPSQLGQLSRLTNLGLTDNYLTQTIPSALGQLESVQFFYLRQNYLTGKLPVQLGDLSAMAILGLYENFFSGTLPSQLCKLSETNALTEILAYSNQLSGTLPSCLANVKSLSEVSLAGNKFTGSVPNEYGNLSRCFYFNISHNSITGSVPSALGSIGSLYAWRNDTATRVAVAVDLSQNSLTGTIPRSLFSTQTETVSLYSNCFHGSLPPDICSSINLQTIALDQLSSGEGCGELSVPGFVGPFARSTMAGSIPSCLWAMPRLETLHLSGNRLLGTIGAIPSTSQLVVVDVSNNYLTGTIPSSMQLHRGFQQLVLSNNKLSGTLLSNFFVLNMTILDLSVNRLSGNVPVSFLFDPDSDSAFSINILAGNLWSCVALPAADPDENYVCGSYGFDTAIYIWVSVSLASVLLAAICITIVSMKNDSPLSTTLSRSLAWWTAGSDYFLVTKWGIDIKFIRSHEGNSSHFREVALSFRHFWSIMDDSRSLVLLTATALTIIALPMFYILKATSSAGMLTNQYTWITTSAFLHGANAATLLVMTVTGAIAIIGKMLGKLNSVLVRTTNGSSRLANSGYARRCLYFWRWWLLQAVSLIVVTGVNIFYLYVILFTSTQPEAQTVAQIALSAFKLMWKSFCVNIGMTWLRNKYPDASSGDVIFHKVLLNVVNLVAGPCLATLGSDTRCLYEALSGVRQINSTFNTTIYDENCNTSLLRYLNRIQCSPQPTNQESVISVTPPWFYSYQCTSALVENYVPVLVLIYAITGVIFPLLRYCMLHTRGLESSWATTATSDQFLAEQSLSDVLVDATVMMTLGLAAPLLAVAIAVKQLTRDVYWKLWVGRLLVSESESHGSVQERLESMTTIVKGDGMACIQLVILFIITFWAASVFDIVADVYGDIKGLIAAVAAAVGWMLIAAMFVGMRAAPRSDLAEKVDRSLDGTGSEVVIVEVGASSCAPSRRSDVLCIDSDHCLELVEFKHAHMEALEIQRQLSHNEMFAAV